MSAHKRRFSKSQTVQRSHPDQLLCSQRSYEPQCKRQASREENHPLRNLHSYNLLPLSTDFDGVGKVLSYHPHSYQLQLFTCLPSFSNYHYHFQQAWESITMDKWVLEIISIGYAIHYTSLPSAKLPYPSLLKNPSSRAPSKTSGRLFPILGALEPVFMQHRGKGFYPRYFLFPKNNSSQRPILDFKATQHLWKGTKIQNNDPCSNSSITGPNGLVHNLQNAYFHIAIHASHILSTHPSLLSIRTFFSTGCTLLSSAPKAFSKVISVVAAHHCRKGILVFPYLDD